jgi:alcohol dehydrogenase (cytochrome c)
MRSTTVTLGILLVTAVGCVVSLEAGAQGARGAPKGGQVGQQAKPSQPGKQQFAQVCARCHGADGRGGEFAPDITARIGPKSDDELTTLIKNGIPAKGMPPSTFSVAQLKALVTYVRTLRPRRGENAPVKVALTLSDGQALQGMAMNRSSTDLQLLTDDKKQLLLLRRVDAGTDGAGEKYRKVTSQVDWPTYHGQVTGNRYTTIDEVTKSNVGKLAPKWVFTLPEQERLEVTPIVVDGVMYVSAANECYALDAGSGRRIWHFQRPKTKGLAGDAASGINRGVAVSGDKLFMVTDHAHLIALNRFTGEQVWEATMADWHQNYGSTSAPLVAGDVVLSGVSGGDEGIRGFVAAFDRETGKEVWRFWSAPKPGDPVADTWKGKDIAHACASTWFTGTYDEASKTLYWPTGNPCPDYDGSQRVGDNLYSDSVVALDVATGTLKWFFQYTPHDLWDWDAQQPAVLVDANWQGQPRKLLLHANRNGFFYVLDRTTGKMLEAQPFVKKLTWASGIGTDGRPVLLPAQQPSPDGTKVCPAVEGATNWYSTAFSPQTGLYYVQTLEKCTMYHQAPDTWQAGRSYYAGSTKSVPDERGQKVLRAIDIQTGKIAWELPQTGSGSSWGGTLATATGLVFFGEDSGALMAVDATNGKPLWQFQTNQLWKASPMTYVFDGHQHIAVASGPNIISFALVQ